MNIIIIGAGNVATHIAENLSQQNDVEVIQIVSKTESSAKLLADKVRCSYTTNLEKLEEADLYIISTNDDSIQKIAKSNKLKDKFVVHTSGSVNINILSENTEKYGVFYPLQTFKKEQKIDFSEIPVCIEASNNEFFDILEKLAHKLTEKVYKIDSEQRKNIHIAAVFVNNFTNHLFYIANQILAQNNVSKEILKPLIDQTFKNIQNNNPFEIQTGPAKRNDTNIINNHIEALKIINVNFAEVYHKISNSIVNTYAN